MSRDRRLLSLPEYRLLARLVKATAHVAPYRGNSSFRGELRYWDALAVVRAYNQRTLMTMPRDVLRRLAIDDYGKHRHWRIWVDPGRARP